MTTSIEIDPNVRVRGNCTYAGFEDVVGAHQFAVGDEVEVVEPEADLLGKGRILEIDVAKELIYLAVDWPSLRPRQRSAMSEDLNYKVVCSWLEVPNRVLVGRLSVSRPHYIGLGAERFEPALELVAG